MYLGKFFIDMLDILEGINWGVNVYMVFSVIEIFVIVVIKIILKVLCLLWLIFLDDLNKGFLVLFDCMFFII